MVIGAFTYLVLNWSTLCKTVMDGFISVGAMAGTGSGTGSNVPDLRDPTQVLNVFWTLAQPIADYSSSLGITDIGKIVLIGFGYIILAAAIFIIAIQCALTYLEFYVVAVVATVLVPFGVNKHLSFLAERSFGAVISHGIKLAVLSFILTAAAPILQNVMPPGSATNPITYDLVFNLDAAALLIAFLAWHAPSIAAGLFGGGPALHAGAAARLGATSAFLMGRMLGSGGYAAGGGRSSLGQIKSAAGAIGSRASSRRCLSLDAGCRRARWRRPRRSLERVSRELFRSAYASGAVRIPSRASIAAHGAAGVSRMVGGSRDERRAWRRPSRDERGAPARQRPH